MYLNHSQIITPHPQPQKNCLPQKQFLVPKRLGTAVQLSDSWVCVGAAEDSWESLGLQGDPTSPFRRRSALGFLWKEWCWSWNSSTLATSCDELTHWKKLWCLEGLETGGEGDNRRWDGWMASLTQWTWVWVNSRSWWWTGRPGVLQFMGLQKVGHDWATDLIWSDLGICFFLPSVCILFLLSVTTLIFSHLQKILVSVQVQVLWFC